MIIQLSGGAAAADRVAARQQLAALTGEWGHELADAGTGALAAGAATHRGDKVIDPVALAALFVSIPSAALAVADLADRIRKRRRASDLIEQARALAARRVAVSLMLGDDRVEIASLDPDRLLELMAEEDGQL